MQIESCATAPKGLSSRRIVRRRTQPGHPAFLPQQGGASMPFEIDRRAFIASLGGTAVAGLMSHEARADALEDFSIRALDEVVAQAQGSGTGGGQSAGSPEKFPTAAELEAQIDGRPYRRGVGNLFASGSPARRLEPMPAKPTLLDFFRLRFQPANHVLQSATRAMKTGMTEEIILACLLHDVVQALIKVDHGWWGAQMFEPYVSEKVSWGIRYHQALRFYPDPSVGYEYPELYNRIYGKDYVPPPYIKQASEYARNHKWYMDARMITVHDLYAFDPTMKVSLDPFIDIIGRHFKQPKEGLGYDNSPVAHMWRSLIYPNNPL
jgi:hypothetical protein